MEREKTFTESLAKVAQIESKLRQRTVEFQRREERIVAAEEELKGKIFEAGRVLT